MTLATSASRNALDGTGSPCTGPRSVQPALGTVPRIDRSISDESRRDAASTVSMPNPASAPCRRGTAGVEAIDGPETDQPPFGHPPEQRPGKLREAIRGRARQLGHREMLFQSEQEQVPVVARAGRRHVGAQCSCRRGGDTEDCGTAQELAPAQGPANRPMSGVKCASVM